MRDEPHAYKVLILAPFPPRLDATHGGGRAIAQLLMELSGRHRIALLCFRSAAEPPVDACIRARCEVVEEAPRRTARPTALGRWLRRGRQAVGLLRKRPMWVSEYSSRTFGRRARALAEAWKPDIVQFEYQVMGQYLSSLHGYRGGTVLTVHDPGAASALQDLRSRRGLGRLPYALDVAAWRWYETRLLQAAGAVVVFTEQDRRTLRELAPTATITPIPLRTRAPNQALDPAGESPASILFVGNFGHPPNIDAATRLADVIFPRVRERCPEALLYLVGDQPPDEVKRMVRPDIVVTGRVPDLVPYLNRAAVVVAPLRLGGGMRVKVLEALAAGKAVVASTVAAAGLDVIHGQQLIIADTDTEFVDAIVELLTHPEQRLDLAVRARTWACSSPGWEQTIAAYETLYQCLCKPTGSR